MLYLRAYNTYTSRCYICPTCNTRIQADTEFAPAVSSSSLYLCYVTLYNSINFNMMNGRSGRNGRSGIYSRVRYVRLQRLFYTAHTLLHILLNCAANNTEHANCALDNNTNCNCAAIVLHLTTLCA